MTKIISIEKTCSACPSQWEMKDENGFMLYGRYRWGRLTIERSLSPTNDIYDAIGEEVILDEVFGDGYDGTMSDEKFKGILLTLGYVTV